MVTPKVSICLTTYNRSELIEESITNILSQSHTNFELFVIDDFSGTEHQKRIRLIQRKLIDSRVNFLFNETNKGLAFNRNLAISLSSGEYFTFKDDDDEWSFDFLKNMVSAMESGPVLPSVTVTGYINKNTKESYRYLAHTATIYDCLIEGYTPPVGGQFYSLALIKSCHGYNNVSSGVDHDLWINIAADSPNSVVMFLASSLVTPDAFLSSNSEKMTTNFVKRTNGINKSLTIWKEKIISRFGNSFYNHFSSEYNFYLCHRFITFAVKTRDVSLLLKILSSRKLSPHVVNAVIYLMKRRMNGLFRDDFNLKPLFRRYRG